MDRHIRRILDSLAPRVEWIFYSAAATSVALALVTTTSWGAVAEAVRGHLINPLLMVAFTLEIVIHGMRGWGPSAWLSNEGDGSTKKSTHRILSGLGIIALSIFMGWGLATIPSKSMEPNLHVGDVVLEHKWRALWIRGVDALSAADGNTSDTLPLKRGEVVVFEEPMAQSRFIKRVIGVPGDTVEVVSKIDVESMDPLSLFRQTSSKPLSLWVFEVRVNGVVVEQRRRLDFSGLDAAQGHAGDSPLKGQSPWATQYLHARPDVSGWRDADNPTAPQVSPSNHHYGSRVSLVSLPLQALFQKECRVEHALLFYGESITCTVPPHHLFVMGDHHDDSLDSRFWGFLPVQSLLSVAGPTLHRRDDANSGAPHPADTASRASR